MMTEKYFQRITSDRQTEAMQILIAMISSWAEEKRLSAASVLKSKIISPKIVIAWNAQAKRKKNEKWK